MRVINTDEDFVSYSLDDKYYAVYLNVTGKPPYEGQIKLNTNNRIIVQIFDDDVIRLTYKIHNYYKTLNHEKAR